MSIKCANVDIQQQFFTVTDIVPLKKRKSYSAEENFKEYLKLRQN